MQLTHGGDAHQSEFGVDHATTKNKVKRLGGLRGLCAPFFASNIDIVTYLSTFWVFRLGNDSYYHRCRYR